MKPIPPKRFAVKKRFTAAAGDDNPKYVSHGDLLKIALHERCRGIETEPVLALCRPEKNFWVFKATVYKSFRVPRLRRLRRRSSWQCLSS